LTLKFATKRDPLKLFPILVRSKLPPLRCLADLIRAALGVLGYDGSGVVVKVGSEAKLFKEGDQVYFSGLISRNGTNAQFVAVDERYLPSFVIVSFFTHFVSTRIVGRKPKNLSWEQAAAEPLTVITAWESLVEEMEIPFATKSDKTLLIINGAGGVGTIAIQLAKKLHGLTVIATASRPETIDICKGYGADFIIDHKKPLKEGLESVGIKSVNYILNCFEADEHWDQFKVRLFLSPSAISLSLTHISFTGLGYLCSTWKVGCNVDPQASRHCLGPTQANFHLLAIHVRSPSIRR